MALLDRYPHMFDAAPKRPPVAQDLVHKRLFPKDDTARQLDTTHVSGVFAKGTLIDTSSGRVLIENLRAGDVVRSFKNGKLSVQSCFAVSDQSIPEFVVCVRSGCLNATSDLITMPSQRVRLNHWLASALFETRFPYVCASNVCLNDRIDMIAKANAVFFRLDIGVCDAITANGVMCITDPCRGLIKDDLLVPLKNYDHRDLTPDETILALEAGVFFKNSGKHS